ncbi:MAG TPA: hypothetical protein VK391_00260 [Allosphingosinicella sp.]|nr:hypothetical protein [Allosphingosinicella sp.]
MALSCAPEHVFLRYSDPFGRVFNVEATSGALPARTQWYRQCLPMSDRAIESGLYMRMLTRRESIVLMAITVAEHLRAEERNEETIALCAIILEQYPR